MLAEELYYKINLNQKFPEIKMSFALDIKIQRIQKLY